MNINLILKTLKDRVTLVQQSKLSPLINGITCNSKDVRNEFLFIAEKGVANDGHKYIHAAIENGATALLVEHCDLIPKDYTGYVLQSNNTRAIAPLIGALFYQNPSEKLFCIGVTGTNGKTSITYILEHLFNSYNKPTGVIGTIDHHIESRVWQTDKTTPHSIEIQSRLHDFVEVGAKTLAIEVTSHAVDQKRVEGIEFDVGIYTNLTRDHLDYHSTMEEYFAVKQSFFIENLGRSNKNPVIAIINNDDSWGAQLKTHPKVVKWTYGVKSKKSINPDFNFTINKMSFNETQFTVQTPQGSILVKSPLIGVHNVYNVIASIAAAMAYGLNLQQIESSLPSFKGIPGRLQRVLNNKNKSVFVDYAHTPDALENVLSSILKIKNEFKIDGKILCVFGCGGDRDKGKRPLMASIAEKYSDLVIVTSDNPRTEDPLQIINEIKTGFQKQDSTTILIEVDRQKAITLALNEAKENDVVIIAGKGHEDYQIIGKEKFYFSDYELARKILL